MKRQSAKVEVLKTHPKAFAGEQHRTHWVIWPSWISGPSIGVGRTPKAAWAAALANIKSKEK